MSRRVLGGQVQRCLVAFLFGLALVVPGFAAPEPATAAGPTTQPKPAHATSPKTQPTLTPAPGPVLPPEVDETTALAHKAGTGAHPATASYNISGTVTHGASGVSGIDVYLYDSHFNLCDQATTAAGGTWSIAAIPGDYILYFYDSTRTLPSGYLGASGLTIHWSEAKTETVVNAAIPGQDLNLPDPLYLSGHISDGSGPLEHAEAVIFSALPEGSQLDRVYTASDGSWTATVAAGTYIVQVYYYTHATGWVGNSGFTYDINDAKEYAVTTVSVGGIDVVMSDNFNIKGLVTDSHAAPISGVQVEAYDTVHETWQVVATGGDGKYTLPVPAGMYKVEFVAHSLGYPDGWYSSSGWTTDFAAADIVTVTSGDVPNIDAAIGGGWHISGRVTHGGSNLSGIAVEAIDSGDNVLANTSTATDGTYSMVVAPGSYKIVFYDGFAVYAAGYWSGSGFTADPSLAAYVVVSSSDVNGINVAMPLPLGKPTGVTAIPGNASATVSWNAPASDGGATILSYSVSSTPDDQTCSWTSGPLSCTVTGLTNGLTYTFTVYAYTLPAGGGPLSDPSAGVVPNVNTYHPIAPVRLLDTRFANGLTGKLVAATPRTFQVTGRNVPAGYTSVPAGATAITANVTVVKPSARSSVYLGPVAMAHPPTATINFNASDVTAYGTTVALSPTGTLSATYMASSGTTDLVMDVTGYFTPNLTGDTYHPLTPARLLDTRSGNGLSGKFKANIPRTFVVRTRGGVPINAKAVTGNLTVTGANNGWAVYIGPSPVVAPKASTINFAKGQTRANSLTVALSSTGTLSATFLSSSGKTTDLVFDVTGYYTADETGAKYVPLAAPTKLIDTRIGLNMTRLSSGTPKTLLARGKAGLPAEAVGITGIVSVYNQTNAWAVFVGPTAIAKPTTSALNFLKTDNCSNGFTVALSASGNVSATYLSSAANTTNLVVIVTGYFVP